MGSGLGASSVWVFLPVTPSPDTALLCPLCLLQLVPKLSRNYLKEGYMEKTGPKVGYEAFFSPSKHESCSVWPQEGVASGTNQPLPERQNHNSVFNALSSPGSKHLKNPQSQHKPSALPGTAGPDLGSGGSWRPRSHLFPAPPSPSGSSKCFETPGSCVVREKLSVSVCDLAFFDSSANRGIQEAMVHHG